MLRRKAAKAIERFLDLRDAVDLELLLEKVVEEGEHPLVLVDRSIVTEGLTDISSYKPANNKYCTINK